MRVNRIQVPVTTDASGDFSATTSYVDGLLLKIHYEPAASNDLDANWNLTVKETFTSADGTASTEDIYTEIDISAAAMTRHPRALINNAADGSASTTVFDYIPITGRLTIVVSDGGNVQSGDVYLYLSDR